MSLSYNIYFELSAAVFLIIMLLFVRIQYNTQSSVNQAFLKLIVLVLAADVMDVVTAVTISYAHAVPVWLNILLSTLYFVTDAVVGYQFMFYFQFYVSRSREDTPMIRVNKLVLGCYCALLLVNLFWGGIFTFTVDGGYVHGAAYPLVYIIPYYFIACSAVILISHFSKFQTWQKASILAYVGLGVLGPALQTLFFPDVLLSLFTLALSLMMIMFTMETPDYQKLVTTIGELRTAEETAEAAKETAENAQKEAEAAREAAQAASRAKTEFLANMSHEIRTPINAIIGYNELIIGQTHESGTSEYAMNVQAAGRTLVSMVSDILDYTMMDKGELILDRAPYYVLELLEDTITYVKQNAKKKNLELRVSTDEKLPGKLSGDVGRLTQIVNNLLSNAVKYTEEGCVELQILWEKKNETEGVMEVTVSDSGIGMKEEDIQRISESFSRFDPTKTRDVQGIGLGLAIVTRLLKLMGSKLQVQSEYGKGSSFSFRLEQVIVDETPIGKIEWNTSRKLQPGQQEETFTAPGLKVLTVDDNAMNLQLFCGMLKDTKIAIDTAGNGAMALELLERNTYDMVFLDHMMPVMDGVETLKEMRARGLCKDTPVIVLTANAVAGEKEMYLEEGFSDYLSKPVLGKQLKEMIQKWLPEKRIAGQSKEDVQWTEAGETTRTGAGIAAAGGQQAETTDTQAGQKSLLDRLSPFLDTQTGMAYCCDSEEFYAEMLGAYLQGQKEDDIRKAYNEKDWDNYRILVHALKSTSLSIGAVECSEQAKALEMAAKENNISFIEAHHEETLKNYRKLLQNISAAIGEQDVAESRTAEANVVLSETDQTAVSAQHNPETEVHAGESAVEAETVRDAQDTYGEEFAEEFAQEDEIPHILVVDDDAMNLHIAEKLLQDKFRVDCVDSGEKALAFLRVEQPNMVLLDLHMPGMDGFAVMRQMKADEAYRDIPIIFLTADDDKDTEVRGFREGALDFITKPFVADIMIQRINRILELDRLKKHLQREVDKQTFKAEERRRKVERMSLQIVSTLAGTIDAKDKYTNGHSTRVAEYSREIARRMGKSDKEQDDIYYMGLLHDIGKIGIPDGIINKDGALTEEEYQLIKSHPVIGSDILKNISELPNIGIGARSHHERYDGSGYPDGLKGEEIPEEARIIGVADTYDAMTSRRSYRDVLPQAVVRDEIEACKGKQIDPQIADVMLQMIDADTEYHMHE
jgi:response regulator RpfG family c-di-GMP phosphodiesterase/signal transduction histidine kinase/HPt (histidine-containing phosphotransfer) domain-containing protein